MVSKKKRLWFEELEFDLPGALLRELVALLGSMQRAPLDLAHVGRISDEQGVYQLYLDDDLVYVGKTDAEAGLQKRLRRHSLKIQQRIGLDPGRVSFKAVRVFVFSAMDLEQQLIKHYGGSENIPPWNKTGFGANDPGRRRDHTVLKKGHFDRMYPIHIKAPLANWEEGMGPETVAQALSRLKAVLPYTLRVQNADGGSKKPHPDLVANALEIPIGARTADEILRLVGKTLGSEWQITVQPGYIMVYKEADKTYPHGQWLSD